MQLLVKLDTNENPLMLEICYWRRMGVLKINVKTES